MKIESNENESNFTQFIYLFIYLLIDFINWLIVLIISFN